MKSEWEVKSLGEAVNFKRGHDLTKKNMRNGIYPVIGSNGQIGVHDEYTTVAPVITIGRSGNLGKPVFTESKAWAHNTTLYITDFKGNYPRFVFYLLQILELHEYGGGSAVPTLNRNHIHPIEVLIPPLPTQKAIADTLSSLDDKIELNNKINANLEKQAQVLFKHWFVDFEFPNEDGLPYKSSGGKMIESELGEIPDGWEVGKLGSFAPIKTGKKNANVATPDGKYMFFTCSQEPLLTDVYSFNESSILVAGNGDFSVKWYSGKFEAYQRTYVLTPYDPLLTAFLYYAVQFHLGKITSGARGSVISFITKGDLENFKFAVPPKLEVLDIIKTFTNINSVSERNKYQSTTLSALRDLLLPKLMSGEIEVPVETHN